LAIGLKVKIFGLGLGLEAHVLGLVLSLAARGFGLATQGLGLVFHLKALLTSLSFVAIYTQFYLPIIVRNKKQRNIIYTAVN